MTTLHLSKQGGAYVIEGAGAPASLSTGFGLRRGTIEVGGQSLPVDTKHARCSGITVGDGPTPLLRLDESESWIPGDGGPRPARWETGRTRGGFTGRLTSEYGVIDLWTPKRRGTELTVSGSWPHLEVIALAASFAMLKLQRRDNFRAAAIATAIASSARN